MQFYVVSLVWKVYTFVVASAFGLEVCAPLVVQVVALVLVVVLEVGVEAVALTAVAVVVAAGVLFGIVLFLLGAVVVSAEV